MSLTQVEYWPIENVKIPVEYGMTGESLYDYSPIRGPELYGKLRSHLPNIEKVRCHQFDSTWWIEIVYWDWNLTHWVSVVTDTEFFSMEPDEMDSFLFYYCNMTLTRSDWKKEGF